MSAIKVYQEWQAKGVATPLDECVKGKFYNVLSGYNITYGLWLPLIPYEHSDAELGADWLHYHYDTRFFSKKMFRRVPSEPSGRTLQIFAIDQGTVTKFVEVRKMRCCLSSLGGLSVDAIDLKGLFSSWARGMVGKSCKGKRCPHRGSNMVERPGGLLECPLHGLFADTKTERIITRGEGISRLREACRE